MTNFVRILLANRNFCDDYVKCNSTEERKFNGKSFIG